MDKLKYYGGPTAFIIELGFNKSIGSIWFQNNIEKDNYKKYRLSLYGRFIGFYPSLEICKFIVEQRIII